jgi:hypothetical protein
MLSSGAGPFTRPCRRISPGHRRGAHITVALIRDRNIFGGIRIISFVFSYEDEFDTPAKRAPAIPAGELQSNGEREQVNCAF